MHIFRILIIFFLITTGCKSAFNQDLRIIGNNAFDRGEELYFEVYYQSFVTGKVKAGYANLKVSKTEKKFFGRSTYHVVGEGKSVKAFDWFFKVRDRFESYFDESAFIPYYFIRNTREGGYKKDDEVTFDHYNGKAISRKKSKSIPPNIQDIISAVYYMRTIDISNYKQGDMIPVPFYLDDSAYVSVVRFNGREKIKTSLGEFKCLSFDPMVATGNVFSNPYPMRIWVTDDRNMIPIMARSEVVVGSVKAELIEYRNLRNPLESKIK